MENSSKQFDELIQSYIESVAEEVGHRFNSWQVDLNESHIYEVITALLSRQLTLCLYLVSDPFQWNGHIAPMFLRCMIDVYINLRWILQEPQERSKQFILYGLGQENLHIEQRKAHLKEHNIEESADPILPCWELWISTKRYPWLTEINTGSWTGKTTRQVAIEASCLEAYRLSYTPFSAAIHSTWSHIMKYNLKTCDNPLHANHSVPVIDPFSSTDITFHYCELAAKYLEMTLNAFDQKFDVMKEKEKSSYEKLMIGYKALVESNND